MPSTIEKIEKQKQLYTIDEQIYIINHEINIIEQINIRKGSIDRINKKYNTIKQLKAIRDKLIQ